MAAIGKNPPSSDPYPTLWRIRKLGNENWRTRKQMIPAFDNDAWIVDGGIDRKKGDAELRKSEVRKHPENPQGHTVSFACGS